MKIVKVNNLPQTYEADTIYLVKSSTAGLMDIYVTDNTGTQIRSLAIDTAAVNSLLQVSEVGVTVASLVDGKIPTNQLPSAILGTLTYQDTWNASTNAPTIPAASPSNKGWYYVVNTAGTASIGGIDDWQIGDWLVSNGVSWGKIDNSDKVSSVAGKTGAVTLSSSDVGLGNVDDTSDANKPVSSAAQTALNLKAPLASPELTGVPTAPTAGGGTNTTQIATTAYVFAERTNTATLTNKTLTSPIFNDGYTEEVFAVTGTTPVLTPIHGSIQTWTLTGNSTPTVDTWNSGQSMTLMVDDGSASTINWASMSITWKTGGGTAPTLLTTGYTVIELTKIGTTIYGWLAGDA